MMKSANILLLFYIVRRENKLTDRATIFYRTRLLGRFALIFYFHCELCIHCKTKTIKISQIFREFSKFN